MTPDTLSGMLGRHPAMLELFRRVRRVAPSDLPVLIVGETGTGKELVARALHQLGPRARGHFAPVNCATIPDTLAETELFGSEPGAYTGAIRRRGWLERARGGTLFLDEVCSTARAVQTKLLRAMEEQEFVRVGGEEMLQTDFRLVAAVSQSPAELVANDVLRRDFLHRLGSCRMVLPPLRERGGDILTLAEHYLRPFGRRLTQDAGALLRAHPWPGNVRELRGVMEALGTLADGPEITADQVLAEIHLDHGATESERVRAVLDAHGWNIAAAARSFGLGRTRFYELLRQHGIERPGAVSA